MWADENGQLISRTPHPPIIRLTYCFNWKIYTIIYLARRFTHHYYSTGREFQRTNATVNPNVRKLPPQTSHNAIEIRNRPSIHIFSGQFPLGRRTHQCSPAEFNNLHTVLGDQLIQFGAADKATGSSASIRLASTRRAARVPAMVSRVMIRSSGGTSNSDRRFPIAATDGGLFMIIGLLYMKINNL
jgi:hypothetical protein